MTSTRTARVARQIQQELSQIIKEQLKDPRVGTVTLTSVQMTPDLRLARIQDRRLRAERQQLRWDQVILRVHFRGGFLQPTLRDVLWAVFVDVACLGLLVWVVSGLVMWWRLARLRIWGAVATWLRRISTQIPSKMA